MDLSRLNYGFVLQKNYHLEHGYQVNQGVSFGALKRALNFRKPIDGMIHHSDRGNQYASKGHIQILKENNIEISMIRKGDYYDNACIESFHSTLKKELIYRTKFKTREEAKLAVWEYNEVRIHSNVKLLIT